MNSRAFEENLSRHRQLLNSSSSKPQLRQGPSGVKPESHGQVGKDGQVEGGGFLSARRPGGKDGRAAWSATLQGAQEARGRGGLGGLEIGAVRQREKLPKLGAVCERENWRRMRARKEQPGDFAAVRQREIGAERQCENFAAVRQREIGAARKFCRRMRARN